MDRQASRSKGGTGLKDRGDSGNGSARPAERSGLGSISFDFPPELLEEIAQRAAELLAARVPAEDHWMTVAEAAEYLRCPISRIYALTSAKRVPHHHDGSRLLFRRSELDTWVMSGGGRRP